MKTQIPATYQHEMKRAKLGCPKDKERTNAFMEVASFLEENDNEQITIHDVISHMEDNLADSEHGAYSYPHMQQKFQEYFGDTVIETEINGKPKVDTFRKRPKRCSMTSTVSRADLDTEKMKIVETAVKLIGDDIKAVENLTKAIISGDIKQHIVIFFGRLPS